MYMKKIMLLPIIFLLFAGCDNKTVVNYDSSSDGIVAYDCSQLGDDWKSYEDSKFPISFCYKKSWYVETSTRDEATGSFINGSKYTIMFSDYSPEEKKNKLIPATTHPVISIESNDFMFTGDSDVGGGLLCWNKDRTSLERKPCLEEKENVEISGKTSQKVHTKGVNPLSQEDFESLEYNINDVFDGYYLTIFTGKYSELTKEMTNELENLVKSIRF